MAVPSTSAITGFTATASATPRPSMSLFVNPNTNDPTNTNWLTSTFTPPAGCLDQYYQLDGAQTQEWLAPFSLDSLTISSCYASEWVQYHTEEAMSWLICPSGYQTQSAWTSPVGYRACCPSGYAGLSLSPAAPLSRPASGATCYSPLPSTGIKVTYFLNGTALSTTTQTSIGPGHNVFANAYDGTFIGLGSSTAADARVHTFPVSEIPSTGVGAPVQTGLGAPVATEELTGSVNIPVITPSASQSSSGAEQALASSRVGRKSIAVVAMCLVSMVVF